MSTKTCIGGRRLCDVPAATAGSYFDRLPRIEYAPGVRAQPPARSTTAQLLLFALLVFQLALGLQQSAGAPHPDTAHYTYLTHDGAAPAHHVATDATGHPDSAHRSISMSTSNDGACPLHTPTPDDKHDCCKSSGCQCQCGSVSLAVNLDAPKGIPASTQVQPITTVRVPTSPPDALFRPPIRA